MIEHVYLRGDSHRESVAMNLILMTTVTMMMNENLYHDYENVNDDWIHLILLFSFDYDDDYLMYNHYYDDYFDFYAISSCYSCSFLIDLLYFYIPSNFFKYKNIKFKYIEF